jgi:hypothetical protein
MTDPQYHEPTYSDDELRNNALHLVTFPDCRDVGWYALSMPDEHRARWRAAIAAAERYVVQHGHGVAPDSPPVTHGPDW